MTGTTYFTADLHLGHQFVAETRGYTNVDEHDRAITNGIRNTLTTGDTLYVLGDISSGREEDYALDVLKKLRKETQATFHIILGNHDTAHPMHRRWLHHTAAFGEVFDAVATQAHTILAKEKLILSHFPYNGDHGDEDRAVQWRPRDLGTPIIHGHTHATEPISYSAQGTLQICVSVDGWDLAPVEKGALLNAWREAEAG